MGLFPIWNISERFFPRIDWASLWIAWKVHAYIFHFGQLTIRATLKKQNAIYSELLAQSTMEHCIAMFPLFLVITFRYACMNIWYKQSTRNKACLATMSIALRPRLYKFALNNLYVRTNESFFLPFFIRSPLRSTAMVCDTYSTRTFPQKQIERVKYVL